MGSPACGRFAFLLETPLTQHGDRYMKLMKGMPVACTLFLFLWAGCASDDSESGRPPGSAPVVPSGESYTGTPFAADYGVRLQSFANYHADRCEQVEGPYGAAACLAYTGKEPGNGLLAAVQGSLDKIDNRLDTADFDMSGVLRLLYQFRDSGLLTGQFREAAEATVRGFKYWPNELADLGSAHPIDSMCTWTENHFILFSSNAYLAGQLYPDAVFPAGGHTGREKMEIFRPRILRWLDLRYRTGFSEWLSNVYYEEDLPAVLNLIDFCEDPEIARQAVMVADLILADIALNQFRGTFGSTHGRSYERHKKNGAQESTRAVVKLLFGMNRFSFGSMAATGLALSDRYRAPRVLYEMATDLEGREVLNRQRIGIRLEEAARWGLARERLEDGMTFLTLEAYTHPLTIELFARMLDEYHWWENSFFAPFKEYESLIRFADALGILPWFAGLFEEDLTRNLRTEANLYTYRTPDYMLSSAQDYRAGYGGDQHHIWQATLGPEAVCFTTHPAKWTRDGQPGGESPNYWTGSGSLPRVAQIENVALVLYDIDTRPGLYVTHELVFTHAWLPREKFDEVVERDGWIFARKGDGYLALWSREPYRWQAEGEDRDAEILADGETNIWVCELGRKAEVGSFEAFVEGIVGASLEAEGLELRYRSPSQGRLEFSWSGALLQDSAVVELSDYPRYGNPYTSAPFPADAIRFEQNGHWLELDWRTGERSTSGLLDD